MTVCGLCVGFIWIGHIIHARIKALNLIRIASFIASAVDGKLCSLIPTEAVAMASRSNRLFT